MKKEENKSINKIVKEIESDSKILLDYPDIFIQNTAIRIKENSDQAKESLRGLRLIFLLIVAILISSIISLFLSVRYYDKAQLIANSSNYNSISKKVLGVEESDSIDTFTYILNDKDSLVTYPDLIKEHEKFNSMKDSLNNYKIFQRIVKDELGVEMIMKQKGDSTTVIVRSIDKKQNNK